MTMIHATRINIELCLSLLQVMSNLNYIRNVHLQCKDDEVATDYSLPFKLN